MSQSHGYFVTLDGPSGVGKTTVGGLLEGLLTERGLQVTLTTQPSPSKIGELARYGTYEYHGVTLSLLIAADRYHHTENVIAPALGRGHVVICDRYIPSSLVLDQLDGVDLDLIYSIYQYLPWPDLAIFLTADPVICQRRAAERGNYSRFHKASLDRKRVEAELFTAIASKLTERQYPIMSVDVGEQPAAQVASLLAVKVISYLGNGYNAGT